jgi:hypothetical protein
VTTGKEEVVRSKSPHVKRRLGVTTGKEEAGSEDR